MVDIPYLIKDLIKSKSLQQFINNRFKDGGKVIIDKNGLFKIVGTENNLFYIDDMLCTIEQASQDYDYSDIRPTDIVLDIGACIGGFSIPASRRCKRVYSVEPILYDSLERNLDLNMRNNVDVLPLALGTGLLNLNWCGHKRSVLANSLSYIIGQCGWHVDFMKCDCEGGEWSIRPEELKGIRRIEIEVHADSNHQCHEFVKVLDDAKFSYKVDIVNDKIILIHAKSLIVG